jgi:hypothetical protein
MFAIVNWNQRRLAPGARPSIIFRLGLAAAGVCGFMLRPCSADTLPKPIPSVRANPPRLAQNDEGDTSEVAPGQVEKYVAVYRAMQRDHGLTVEQAALQQGLTLQAFRQLENRIERDEAAREQARRQLQAAAANESASPTPTPSGN